MTIDYTVTRRALTLGNQNATTGWYEQSYTTTDIDMIIVPRGSPLVRELPAGIHIRESGVGLTQDVVAVGDEIYHPTPGTYYEVVSVTPHYVGDSFYFYECQLHELPYHE